MARNRSRRKPLNLPEGDIVGDVLAKHQRDLDQSHASHQERYRGAYYDFYGHRKEPEPPAPPPRPLRLPGHQPNTMSARTRKLRRDAAAAKNKGKSKKTARGSQ